MSAEGRGWVTRVGIDLVNWQQEEPADFDGGRQPSMGGTSRMSREAQVRICERLGVKLLGSTRHSKQVRSRRCQTEKGHPPAEWPIYASKCNLCVNQTAERIPKSEISASANIPKFELCLLRGRFARECEVLRDYRDVWPCHFLRNRFKLHVFSCASGAKRSRGVSHSDECGAVCRGDVIESNHGVNDLQSRTGCSLPFSSGRFAVCLRRYLIDDESVRRYS